MKKRCRKIFASAIIIALAAILAVSFVACKTKTYTLTFETNGGTEIAPITAAAGEAIVAPSDPVKDGFSFEGWYAEPDFSGEKAVLPSVMPENDSTYYARFAPLSQATITLDATEYGTLQTTKQVAYVGTKISEAIKNLVPQGKDDAVFSQWFLGDEPIGNRTLTKDVKLTAKYTVDFSARVRKQNTDGTYSDDWTRTELPERITENKFVGDVIDVSSDSIEKNKYEGFTFDADETIALTLGTKSSENVYLISYKRKWYTLRYDSNLPSGVSSGSLGGTMPAVSYRAESEVTVSENAYTLNGYRFAGWAKTQNGTPDVEIGSALKTTTSDVTLYAVWNYGNTDVNGGQDKIFVLKEKSGTVVLERYGLDDKEGTYDATTGEFVFKEGTKTVLSGRILSNGTFSYMDENYKNRTFVRYDRKTGETISGETLVTDGLFHAEYTCSKDGSAVTVNGSYEKNSDDFVYTADGGNVKFVFRLNEENDTFVVRNEEETAVLLLSGSLETLMTIDGFGNATYTSSDGTFNGTYSVTEKDLPTTDLAFDFTVGDTTLHCEATKEDGTLYGSFVVRDELKGEYVFEITAERRNYTRTLTLDGYGNGKYIDQNTTVETAVTYTLYTLYGEPKNGEWVPTKWYISYTASDGEENAFRVDVDGETYEVDRTTAQKVDTDAGYYSAVVDRDAGIRIFIDGDRKAYVYPESDMTLIASAKYSLSQDGVYTLSEVEFGSVDYAKRYADLEGKRIKLGGTTTKIFLSGDALGGNVFRYKKDGKTYTASFNGFCIATLSEHGGTAFNEVYSYICSFDDKGKTKHLFLITDGDNGAYYVIGNDEEPLTAVDINAYTVEMYEDFLNRMPETKGETLAIRSDFSAYVIDAEFNMITKGNIIVEGDDVYTFSSIYDLSEGYKSYEGFTFKKGNDGYFYAYRENEVLTSEKLTLDGYGRATYLGKTYAYEISAEIKTATGAETYEYYTLAVADENNVYSLRLTFEDGEYVFKAPYEDAAAFSSWEYSDNGVVSGEKVILLDGYYDTAIMYRNNGYTYAQIGSGTYVKNTDGTYTAVIGGEEITLKLLYRDKTNEKSFVTPNAGFVKTYVSADGTTLSVDEYGNATNGTDNGFVAFAPDSDLDGLTVVVFYVQNADGSIKDTVSYQADGDGIKKIKSNNIHGKYSLYVGGTIKSATLLLDWTDGAIYKDGDKTVKGTYVLVDAVKQQYEFIPEDETEQGFKFIYMVTRTGNQFTGYRYGYYFQKLDIEYAGKFVSAEWGTLTLDGYNKATIVTATGEKRDAAYKVTSDSLVRLYYTSGTYAYYRVDPEQKTFSEITDEFYIENGTLIAYQGSQTTVTVPSEVTKIGERAFFGKNVTSITIGAFVTEIDEYAFGNCSLLSSVKIESNLTLGAYAFYECISLEEITLPDGLTTIPSGAFYNCSSLKKVNGLENAEVIGEMAFARTGLTAVTLTAIRRIESSAFAQCFSLSTVSTGRNLVFVGTRAFALCDSDKAFVWTMESEIVPETRTEILYRTIDGNVTILVKDITVALAFAKDSVWSAYAEKISVATEKEPVELNGGDDTLTLDENSAAYLNGEFIGFYEYSGSDLVVYEQANGFAATTATEQGGTYTLTLDGKTYTFVRK